MSALGEVLPGNHVYTYKGKQYPVKLIDHGVMLDYERQLFSRAVEAAKGMKHLLDKDEYQEHLKKLNDDYLAGEYSFLSEKGRKALTTTHGMLTLCTLLFNLSEAELIKVMASDATEITNLIQVIIKESFPDMIDPKNQ